MMNRVTLASIVVVQSQDFPIIEGQAQGSVSIPRDLGYGVSNERQEQMPFTGNGFEGFLSVRPKLQSACHAKSQIPPAERVA
jgi:hypothetical protein